MDISHSNSARCGTCVIAGSASSSISDCYRLGTWNVRSLYQSGKLACVIQEMKKLNLDLLGVLETFWNNCGEFLTSIPTLEEKFKVIYSGGEKHRRGVGFILNLRMDKSVLCYDNKSERLACIKIQATPCNILIIQTYAPNEDAEEEEKDM